MKIKVKKEMNLHELIKWAWENSIKHKEFTGSRNGIVEFDFRGWVRTDLIEPDEIFEVEVEEEITEETVIPLLLEVYEHEEELVFLPQKEKSIKDLLEESDLEENITTKTLYLINDDGTLTLVWKDGELVE
ncbi:hypothetical protein [Staphylococcus delphini]|uniref:hypothetical protein n=1 Tax=Staphylococcus delphini TaxID=53344 RepID=UPI0021D11875|nr:hypothetical protein [Staphylococcus delphini]UXS43761.1 hypothetical protein MUA39_10405 [Staphylococcus delphini]UXV46294.1 hypothetical protein MUA63_13505 [Staphylococcus delphini]